MIDPADLARMNQREPTRSVLYTSILREELRDFYKYELLSQKREARLGVLYCIYLFLGFCCVFLNADLVRLVTISGGVLSLVMTMINWRWHSGILKQLETM